MIVIVGAGLLFEGLGLRLVFGPGPAHFRLSSRGWGVSKLTKLAFPSKNLRRTELGHTPAAKAQAQCGLVCGQAASQPARTTRRKCVGLRNKSNALRRGGLDRKIRIDTNYPTIGLEEV